MLTTVPSHHRLPAALAVLAMLAVVVVVGIATDRAFQARDANTHDRAAEELGRLDDFAAAAEARVILATLRSNLADPKAGNPNGPHARALREALRATFERDASARAEAWTAMAEAFGAFREEVQGGDPAVLQRVVQLESLVRAYRP